MLALDVDGTITLPGKGHELDLGLVALLHKAEAQGLARVVPVSGTPLPILAGLAIYLRLKGLTPPRAGAVFSEGKVIELCRTSARCRADRGA